ncbi:hypothetical protein BJX70DRAFT_390938 [Aspergillus crustosus]
MSQKAIITTANKQASLIPNQPFPTLQDRDDYILIETICVALNLTDLGCDYAGTVKALGPAVKRRFRTGDRVSGVVHGSDALQPEDGSFAEYIVAKGDIQFRIPEDLSMGLVMPVTAAAAAATAPTATTIPSTKMTTEPEPILIYGGSTTTGSLAIQFAKLSGYRVLTTCSPHNVPLVRSLSADAVFDYRDPQSATAIQTQTSNRPGPVLDIISLSSSAQYRDTALSTQCGVYMALLPDVGIPRSNVADSFTVAYTSIGEGLGLGQGQLFEASPAEFQFAERISELAQGLVDKRMVRAH